MSGLGRHDFFAEQEPQVDRVSTGGGASLTGQTIDFKTLPTVQAEVVYQGAGEVFDAWIEQSKDGVAWTEVADSRVTLTAAANAQSYLWQIERDRYQEFLRIAAS